MNILSRKKYRNPTLEIVYFKVQDVLLYSQPKQMPKLKNNENLFQDIFD